MSVSVFLAKVMNILSLPSCESLQSACMHFVGFNLHSRVCNVSNHMHKTTPKV